MVNESKIAILFVVVLAFSNSIHAQQPNAQLTPEDIAFNAVSSATNPAARLAAAEDFITNFPKSSKRAIVAKLVSEQLPVLRNVTVASSMVDRARAIFTAPDELEFLRPVALEVYANARRADEAFDAHSVRLARGKVEHQVLVQQIIPDLTSYYKYRHNGTITGLQKLIEKYEQ